jgi:hypothetical protein
MTTSEFEKFESMRQAGASVADVYRAAIKDGVREIEMYRLLRGVFGLSLLDAKKAIAEARGTKQPDLADLDSTLKQMEEESDGEHE